MTPARIESRAERRADRALFEVGQRRRQRARPQRQRQVRGFLLREAAGDAALVGDAALDDAAPSARACRGRSPSCRPMFAPVTLPNLHGAVLLQREADRRLVVLVERRPRVAQVAAGDDRHLAAPGSTRRRPLARRRRVADAGHDLHVRRQAAAVGLRAAPRRVERALLDELQLEQRRRPDDLLGAADVGDARAAARGSDRAPPCRATIGSATPSSLTRRSIVWMRLRRPCRRAAARRCSASSRSV